MFVWTAAFSTGPTTTEKLCSLGKGRAVLLRPSWQHRAVWCPAGSNLCAKTPNTKPKHWHRPRTLTCPLVGARPYVWEDESPAVSGFYGLLHPLLATCDHKLQRVLQQFRGSVWLWSNIKEKPAVKDFAVPGPGTSIPSRLLLRVSHLTVGGLQWKTYLVFEPANSARSSQCGQAQLSIS